MLVPGKTVATLPLPKPASIPLSSIPSARTPFAACTIERPLLKVIISCKACALAAAALAGQALRPSALRSKPGMRLVDCTTLPEQKSAEPATEIAGGNVEVA